MVQTQADANVQSGQSLPGPKGLPWLGNLLTISRKGMYPMIRKSWDTYGDGFRIMLGGLSMNVFLKPDDIKHVFLTNRHKYGKRQAYDGIRMLVGNGLLTSEGDEWRERRRVMQPAFHRPSIMEMCSDMTDAGVRLLEDWEREYEDGQSIEIYSEMMHVTLDIIGRTLFNIDLSSSADKTAQAFHSALEILSVRGNNLLNLPMSIPTPSNRKLKKALTTLDEMVFQLVQDRLKMDNPPKDLLSMLLAAKGEDGEPLPVEDVRDEIITMFLAGHETTAIALTWTWYLLAQHPEVEAKLHEEWDNVLGGRIPTSDDLANLPYTKMVFQESMRLYSPVWSNARDTLEQDLIRGYEVEKGSMVFICPYLTHRHPDYWEDPDRFWPERFNEVNSKGRHKYAYVPFSVGPRMCIGNHFSTFEAQLLLATFGQKYRFALDPKNPPEMNFQITLRPKDGLRVFMHKR